MVVGRKDRKDIDQSMGLIVQKGRRKEKSKREEKRGTIYNPPYERAAHGWHILGRRRRRMKENFLPTLRRRCRAEFVGPPRGRMGRASLINLRIPFW